MLLLAFQPAAIHCVKRFSVMFLPSSAWEMSPFIFSKETLFCRESTDLLTELKQEGHYPRNRHSNLYLLNFSREEKGKTQTQHKEYSKKDHSFFSLLWIAKHTMDIMGHKGKCKSCIYFVKHIM